ncbi:hypothetical protein CPB86DRAFT_170500 [Serendipita vermifera]|nr:hypothetical protein CPB86DRAFT_170500 [Serendipita vermifera]
MASWLQKYSSAPSAQRTTQTWRTHPKTPPSFAHIPPVVKSSPPALLSEDIVYLILTTASNSVSFDYERREHLFRYSLVCQIWSRAAQSLLFRHVFLQIRSSTMALLEIINHNTERGRRLAGYIKSAEIRLSKLTEERDPPSLPFIHPRHLPALLCHMPNLYELDLTFGEQKFKPEIITALSRGPPIRIITIKETVTSQEHPLVRLLGGSPNLWPHLACVTVKHADRSSYVLPEEGSNFPNIALKQVVVDYPSAGSFDDVSWLIHNSREVTHVTMTSNHCGSDFSHLKHSNLRNMISLTLGRVAWTDDLFRTIHTFNRLKELRFMSLMRLERNFGQLPDTIEHLVLVTPFFRPSSGGIEIDTGRPALLRTCQLFVVDRAIYCCGTVRYNCGHQTRSVPNNDDWITNYASLCRGDGVYTRVHRISDQSESARKADCNFIAKHVSVDGFGIPPALPKLQTSFQPTPSLLDLTGFDVIEGRYDPEPDRKTGPSPSLNSATSKLLAKIRKVFWKA